jgi:hypothetical protein
MAKESITFVCQSCAALVRHPEEAGTTSVGRRDDTYCRRCYGNGRFVEPRLTLEEMVHRVAEDLLTRGMSAYSAGAELAETIAGLERWRAPGGRKRQPSDIPTQKTPQLVISRKSDTR